MSVVLLLVACTPGADDTSDVSDTSEPAPDLREPGTARVERNDGIVTASCEMAWRSFAPAGASDPPLVVLSHGFARSAAQLEDLARHVASWGAWVVTPELCNASFLNADHEANAADLQRLVDDLGADGVVYTGHSAGGLASLLAAADDPRALGLLGLDPVDAEGLGAAAAPQVRVPGHALLGEPSECNSQANGTFYGETDGGKLLEVVQADHCDFESPTDGLCELACPDAGSSISDDEVRATIRGLATAHLLDSAGLRDDRDAWWTPGGRWYDELAGRVR